MDLFLLFVVIFLSVMLGIGLSAILLSLLFKLILRLPGGQRSHALRAAPSQAPRT